MLFESGVFPTLRIGLFLSSNVISYLLEAPFEEEVDESLEIIRVFGVLFGDEESIGKKKNVSDILERERTGIKKCFHFRFSAQKSIGTVHVLSYFGEFFTDLFPDI